MGTDLTQKIFTKENFADGLNLERLQELIDWCDLSPGLTPTYKDESEGCRRSPTVQGR
jgi:hypothetical protein